MADRNELAGKVRSVAALCVQVQGPYPKLVYEWWDAQRDVRNFPGGYRVVAHPPCNSWGRLRAMSYGNNAELGPLCVHHVRTWGGVLEHPAGSKLWKACGMPPPGSFPDRWGGFTIETTLNRWGSPLHKPTWLYCVGVQDVPEQPAPGPVTKRVEDLSGRHRSETPMMLARWLVYLAGAASFAPRKGVAA